MTFRRGWPLPVSWAPPALVLLLLFVLAACTPNPQNTPSEQVEDTAAPPPTITPIIPTAPRIIVTLTPRPSLTPIPSPTLPYDIYAFNGDWILTVRVLILGQPYIDQVRFFGLGSLSTRLDGSISGRLRFNASPVDQPPCRMLIPESIDYDATVGGALRLGEDNLIYADLVLSPSDPDRATTVEIYCTSEIMYRYQLNMLWTALDAVRGMTLTLPFEPGYTDVSTADLTGPSRGLLYGSVQIETTLTR